MRSIFYLFIGVLFFSACSNDDYEKILPKNPALAVQIPENFPAVNAAYYTNTPTEFGVALGEKLFNDKRFSTDNSISCASCHIQSHAFADDKPRAIGVANREGIRNTPPIQNLAFMKFYNWDGSKLQLEKQAIVPIITHEEMDSSLSQVIAKISKDEDYTALFIKAFGDEEITSDRIYKSIAQYEYTLISANSKYDKVVRDKTETFTETEQQGYEVFQQKCASCHATDLFTDQSFRNIGFPLNTNTNETGRARVTGNLEDYMSFRVPSLRNIAYTAPYGSFGQFNTLKEVLDYFDEGVLEADNLDPIFKENNNSIPLTEQEKEQLIAFMHTLSDAKFVSGK